MDAIANSGKYGSNNRFSSSGIKESYDDFAAVADSGSIEESIKESMDGSSKAFNFNKI